MINLGLLTVREIGIGQCCAYEFALHGCKKLFLVDLSLSKLEKTKTLISRDGLSPQMELFEGNVSDEGSMRAMLDRCVEIYGKLDVACNNAGVSGAIGRTSETSMKDFDLVCSVNERGVSGPMLQLSKDFFFVHTTPLTPD